MKTLDKIQQKLDELTTHERLLHWYKEQIKKPTHNTQEGVRRAELEDRVVQLQKQMELIIKDIKILEKRG